MKYYATYNDSGKLLGIGTGSGQTEISKEEYDFLLSEISEKVKLVQGVCAGDVDISEVKEEWQEEIQRRAEKEKEYIKINQNILASEALNIITGGEQI